MLMFVTLNLQDLKPDRIAKYAIGHTASFAEVCKEVWILYSSLVISKQVPIYHWQQFINLQS